MKDEKGKGGIPVRGSATEEHGGTHAPLIVNRVSSF